MPAQNRKSKGRQGRRAYSVNARDAARTPAPFEGPPGLETGFVGEAIVPNLLRSVSHYQVQFGDLCTPQLLRLAGESTNSFTIVHAGVPQSTS